MPANNPYYQNFGQQPYYGPPQQPYYGQQQPYYPPPQPPKRRRRGGCLSTLLVLAVLIGAGIYLYPKYSSFIPPEIRAYIEQIIGKPVTTHPETLAGITSSGFWSASPLPTSTRWMAVRTSSLPRLTAPPTPT